MFRVSLSVRALGLDSRESDYGNKKSWFRVQAPVLRFGSCSAGQGRVG